MPAELKAMNFQGKRVWVTGAGQGIGCCVAKKLCALNAEVIGLDQQFNATDYPFQTEFLDVSNPTQVECVCKTLLAANPRLDVLINVAGLLRLGTVDELGLDDWKMCFDVNVSGVFYLLRQLVPIFKQRHSGAIVTVASNAAHVPRLRMAAYCASKAALVSLSHCVGLELAPFGVRCNLVSPGSTDTAMLRGMSDVDDMRQKVITGLPEDFKLGIPLGKIATPDEIAHAVLFLASDMASHITLQDLVVDGGATLAA